MLPIFLKTEMMIFYASTTHVLTLLS